MNLRKLGLLSALFGTSLFVASVVWAQTAGNQSKAGDLKIRSIRQQQIDAPNFGSAQGDLGGRPATLWRKWLKIEVQFESDLDWADDVQLKYYVLVGKGREARLFSGELTHINVAKGSQHYSAMFIQPNTLRRYGAGQIEAVAVQLFHQNRLLSMESDPKAQDRWWEKYTPMTGFLLAPQETPWAPVAHERFEAVKPSKP